MVVNTEIVQIKILVCNDQFLHKCYKSKKVKIILVDELYVGSESMILFKLYLEAEY